MPQLDEAAIFNVARRIDKLEDRRLYIDQVCGANRALQTRVEALLRAQDEDRGFLEIPAVRPQATADHRGPDHIGAQIGPYRLIRQIGEGGFGVVYLAEQQQPIRRKVAVKVLKPGMDTRQVVARFEAERQALALMEHGNIARVLDGGETASGRSYFVMELVDGIPITRYCDEHQLTPRERLALFVPVCQAIQHAHQKGIIHRDVKPTNVLVAICDGQPVPKVIDFGVAKALGQPLTERTLVTGLGGIVGTLEYMSPEQADFHALDIDTRSDVYSLGVLLYELFTGTTPLTKKQIQEATIMDVLRLIREEEPPRPSTRLSDSQESLTSISVRRNLEPAKLTREIRGDLDWIVMKALDKDRTRRYETANSLAADVLRYLHGEPVEACPPSVGYRVRKFVLRNKSVVLAATLLVLALVAGIIGTTWQMIRATIANTAAVREARQKEAALGAAQQSEREATEQLFLALWNQARAGRFSRQAGQQLDSLAALAKAASIRRDQRLRDDAIAAMTLPDVRRVPVQCSAPSDTTIVGYGGQYRLYARANDQGILSVRSLPDDQEVQRIIAGRILGTQLHFSPDERFVLGQGEGNTLRVWRIADGQQLLQEGCPGWWGHAFSPDGSQLAIGDGKSVVIFELATGRAVRRWSLPTRAESLAYHPEGDKLAVGYQRFHVTSIYDARSGGLLADLPVGAIRSQIVAWHPDGTRLAVASDDPRIQIWNVAAKRKVATLEGHVQNVTSLTFHPAGSLVASYSWDGDLRLWDPATGRPLLRLPLVVGNIRFSGDGRWLVANQQGQQTELLEVIPNPEYRTLVSSGGLQGGGYNQGDFSPDGRLLAVALDEGARVWDLPTGRELAALPAWTNYVFFEGWDVEGDSLAHNHEGPGLLTGGRHGLLRWSVTRDDSDEKRLRLGPPRQLSPLHQACFARTPDGHTLAVATQGGEASQFLNLKTGAIRRDPGVHPLGEIRALSRDGQWAASCGWHSNRVRLWNAATGALVHDWIVKKHTFASFTPDSRILIISQDDELAFWDIATFEPIRRLEREVALYSGYVAFSPDGRLMAVEMTPATIHLMEVATGRTVAKLDDPHGDRATWQGFTPDGTQLVVASTPATAIHIWDLRAIRTRLKSMNLDWDWPEFPPAVVNPETPRDAYPPRTIAVLVGDLDKRTREQTAREAIARARRALELDPDSPDRCNQLAWALAMAPEASSNTEEALALAEKAVRLAEKASFRNTLGVVYYRTGRYRDAVETLRMNLATQTDRDLATDLYLLAMSCHRLGDIARARDYYDWAVRWTEIQRNSKRGTSDALAAFQAEADEVFGIQSAAKGTAREYEAQSLNGKP